MPQKLTDAQFIKAWALCGGSPATVARETGLGVRSVYARRADLERRGTELRSNPRDGQFTDRAPPAHFERRRNFTILNGTAIVFSDPHWLPDHGRIGTDALEVICHELKPQLVVCGGDALDGTQIGRWDPTRGHHKQASLREQLDCMKANFDSVQNASGKAQFAWTIGNHDLRLSRYVAVHAEHMLDLPFTRLEDWVPGWPLSWTVEINAGTAGMTVIRHRNQAGMLHLQGQKAGCHYVHGHLHKLNVHRLPTFAGVRYSIDAGSLADPSSDVFDYAEGGPDHAQGFAVLTFKDGKLLPPELCEVLDGDAIFRGEVVA